MKRFLFTVLAAVICLTLPVGAQTSLKDALIKHWQRSADLTIAVADAMPAADYGFRPNPAEMSFGQLMAHIAVADMSACGAVRGEKLDLPPKIAEWAKDQDKVAIDKATAMPLLKDAFASCQKTLSAVTPESLEQTIGTGERAQTRFELLWSYFTHTAHHRGQAEVYLRLKDIKPPTYVF
jgi:uncharacterized damage-inducible protein DinB